MGLEPFKDHAKSPARSGWVRDSDVAKGHRAPPKDFAMATEQKATKLFAKVAGHSSDALARRRFVSMAWHNVQQQHLQLYLPLEITHHNNTRGAVRGRITHHQIFLRPEVFFSGERSSPQPRAKVGLETSSSRRTSSSWAALAQVKPHEEPNKPHVVHVPLAQWASLPRVFPIAP